MRSIQLQSALYPLRHSQLKHIRKQLQAPKLLPWLSNNEPIRLLGTSQRHHLQGRTKATLSGSSSSSSTHLVLGLASPAARSPDVSAFILISVLLLVFYLLSNFIVPYLISKYYRFDKADNNQEGGDDNDFGRWEEGED